MKRIYESQETALPFSRPVSSEKWTAIIPAAGQGSRLGFHLPKLLFPVLGKSMIQWMVELLKPTCGSFVFVLSPAHRAEVEAALAKILPAHSFQIAIQETPTGMADAILLGCKATFTPFAMIAWVDQITLRPETISGSAQVHEHRPHALLTLPTVLKKKPYIHFERDPEGKITKVLQARENEINTEEGESDCGLFLFTTPALLRILTEAKDEGAAKGRSTGEFNLLPLLPRFEGDSGELVSLRIAHEEETIGVNTPEEAAHVSQILTQRITRRAL